MVAVTAIQYEQMRGFTSNGGAVRKAIKIGQKLPDVQKIDKFGKSHRLWVSDEFYRKNKKKIKKLA